MSDTTTTLRTYLCDDGNAEIEIRAESHEAAAREYVDGGDWGESTKTDWVRVWVQEVDEDGNEIGERERHTVAIDPDEPDCIDGHDHEWESAHEVVGGLKENPGVYGHGGGVVITEVCRHCGAYRVTDTWAQDMSTGEQGLTSIEYREADDASSAWVESLREDE